MEKLLKKIAERTGLHGLDEVGYDFVVQSWYASPTGELAKSPDDEGVTTRHTKITITDVVQHMADDVDRFNKGETPSEDDTESILDIKGPGWIIDELIARLYTYFTDVNEEGLEAAINANPVASAALAEARAARETQQQPA